MARGWESKSVEFQQEEADGRRPERTPVSATQQEIAALEHTRKRIESEIAASGNERFREIKRRALRHVEEQIAQRAREI